MYLTIKDIEKDWLFYPKGGWGWVRKPIQDTLRMAGENPGMDLRNTPYYDTSVQEVANGKWWYGAKTADDCVKHTAQLIELCKSVGRAGVRDPVTIRIKDDGRIWIHDGYHRLFCADYAGCRKPIPVRIEEKEAGFQAIEELLLKRGNGKKVTYHPLYDESSALYHPYFKDWKAWRTDCPIRYKGIFSHLGNAKTVLDIGPCEGSFSINLAAEDYKVTAVELHPERAEILRFFANLRGVNIDLAVEDWRMYCSDSDREFDAILFLGTFHHQLIHSGQIDEFKRLGLLKGKRLFFEMATNRDPRMKGFPSMSNSEIVRRVIENTRFTEWEKVYTSRHPNRSDGFMFS